MFFKTLLSIVAILLLSGCTTTGSTQLDSLPRSDLESKIIKYKSTMSDILEIIGEPTSTELDSQYVEIWTYDYSSSRKTLPSYIPLVKEFSSGVKNESKKLIIYFDENRVVQDYTYSSKNIEENSGFLH